ncbi:uncharacterized protein J7T54_005725 [Emericellopsis cladophorae]|uniref:Cytochrome P450 n=1 Tax=Emericellopsis cladophorae TaxID=2686198 RepID=A0A9P9XXU0_9HYPO|nr:uncharacterized protein J7T54_005725 [Emericellopsis cladophorae]KAI6779695.1 hypothetical protein J7T54_005725 [Emericellopsis cladophorae]
MTMVPLYLPGYTTACLVAALPALLYALHRFLLPSPFPNIPYDKDGARSLFGDLPAMLRKGGQAPLDWLITRAYASGAGPLSQVFLVPFGRPVLLLMDFHESSDVMMRRKEWDRSDWSIDFLKGILPKHQINLKTGPEWKAHRRLLQDLMSPSFLYDTAAPNLYRSVEKLVALWQCKADMAQGKPFDAAEDVFFTALDGVIEFGYGEGFSHRSIDPQLSALRDSKTATTTVCQPATRDGQAVVEFQQAPVDDTIMALLHSADAVKEVGQWPWPRLGWWWYWSKPSARRERALRQSLNKHQVELAVQRMQEQKDKSGSFRSAVDCMMTGFIIAGHDTTSTTISWGLKLLADHPEAQSRLREALRDAHASAVQERRAPTHSEISKASVPLLDATIEEILRLGGTTTFLERQCNSDTTLLGHHVPKGTLLIMAQRGPSITAPSQTKNASKSYGSDQAAGGSYQVPNWNEDDVGLFKPERWLTKDDKGDMVYDSQAGPMLSFGAGLRGCFGRRLAYVQLKLLVTMLVWHFEFLACPEALSSYARVEGLTQKPEYCYVRLQRAV